MTTDFSDRLLRWFDTSGRKHLPWQQQISPYRVWVSEIMLQQTQVATVIGYFERFMQRFPTIDQLADASEDEVLHLWTGLGYYARARNLHKTARTIIADFNGEFPANLEQLVALPGIGRSTAGAIISIACGGRAAILDGNVKRVLARCFGVYGWPGQTPVANALWEIAERLTPTTRVNDYTQAIMDLGATLCTRSRPDCNQCPMLETCVAHKTDEVERLPGKKTRQAIPVRSTYMLVIENSEGEFLLEKRPSRGLWGGLWGFPETEPAMLDAVLANQALEPVAAQVILPFRHTFTHFHLDITPLHVRSSRSSHQIGEPDRLTWYDLQATQAIGLTRPVTRIFAQLKDLQKP
ncbi:MAG: A/G-specific adenine glycosylase [SAR86 cluster bacterium]|uniref:Adenine DNA glycosylase n=1 Tax=SAR86 cluster bacterium TaxID=2030880 RepID=A0A972VYW9_9GAMM|nr:A/G-specific adenine glycosylase [SAR86 cluster bacterium]